MTSEHDQYFEYLMTRSRLGHLYRQHVLYPRLTKRLRGRTADIGCGIGDMLAFRANSVGVDINPHTVEFCRKRGLDAHVMAPDVLPFDDASLDSVLLDNVLEHVAEPQRLLEQIHRVLRPRGRLLVGVPGERGFASDPDHKVRYDEETLVARIAQHGFACAELFWMPLWRSAWLSRHTRQYCVYGVFDRT
jgi:SAM-dependent methyltransferase